MICPDCHGTRKGNGETPCKRCYGYGVIACCERVDGDTDHMIYGGKMSKNEDLDLYRELLRIDKNNLDDALIEQSDIFYRVSEDFVEASSQTDQAKENLAVVDAELDASIRRQMEADDEKITEGKVRAAIQSDGEHEEAYDSWIAAKRKADLLNAMKDSFRMRSTMLKQLAELYISNYFTTESVKGPSKDAQADRNKKAMAEKRRGSRPKPK